MLNGELYEKLEREFARHRIGGDVEDVLLELAEALADQGVVGKELSVKEQMGRVKLEARGTCEKGEDGEEPGVFIRTLFVDGKEFEIEDYLL